MADRVHDLQRHHPPGQQAQTPIGKPRRRRAQPQRDHLRFPFPIQPLECEVDIALFQQNKAERFQDLLDSLAQKADMNPRVLKMSVGQKVCQVTRTTKLTLPAVAQRFKGSTSVTIAVKKNGSIEIVNNTITPT